MKTKNRSRKRSHKVDEIGVERIRTVPFSSDSMKTRLSESEAEAGKQANHKIRAQALRLLSAAIDKHIREFNQRQRLRQQKRQSKIQLSAIASISQLFRLVHLAQYRRTIL